MRDYEKAYNDAMARLELVVRTGMKLDPGYIFPELAESEDERIRKFICSIIDNLEPKDFVGVKKMNVIAWLEKQKTYKPTSTEDMPYITDERFYEIEPADSFKYKLAEYMTKNYRKVEGPYGHTYAISAESILQMAEEELLKRGELQKPAEWSEEDETKLRDVVRLIEDSGHVKSIREHYKNFLTSLPERFNLRPEQWSEEEKQKLNRIYEILGYAADDKGFLKSKRIIGDKEAIELQDFLKFLRPHPKCEIYKSAKHDLAIRFMNYLDENRPEGKMSLSSGECEDIDKAFKENDWAKIIRYVEKYRPSWKPSEDEERLINTSISFLKDFADKGYENAVECIDWLKSKLNGNSCK